MRAALRGVMASIAVLALVSSLRLALAQPAPPPDPQRPAYTPSELVNAGHRFFGSISVFFPMILLQSFFGSGNYSIVGPYMGELWPARLRGSGMGMVAFGFVVLGGYGILVNLLQIDFSRLLGAYVGVFAIVSVLTGRLVFHDHVPASTWIGLAIILVGSLVIHVGWSS